MKVIPFIIPNTVWMKRVWWESFSAQAMASVWNECESVCDRDAGSPPSTLFSGWRGRGPRRLQGPATISTWVTWGLVGRQVSGDFKRFRSWWEEDRVVMGKSLVYLEQSFSASGLLAFGAARRCVVGLSWALQDGRPHPRHRYTPLTSPSAASMWRPGKVSRSC